MKRSIARDVLSKDVFETEYLALRSLRKLTDKYHIDRKTLLKLANEYGISVSHRPGGLQQYSYDEEFFTRENEATFYVAGFLAADGCVQDRDKVKNTTRVLIVNLSSKDSGHLHKMRELLSSNHRIKDVPYLNSFTKKQSTMSVLRISITEKVVNDLAKYNIVPRKGAKYMWSDWLKNHPLRHHFIRGYNDGDGCFSLCARKRSEKQLMFSLVGFGPFLLDIHRVFEEEGVISPRNKNLISRDTISVLKYCGNGIVADIADYLYSDSTIYLPRKYNIVEPYISI